jgi:hypothetical protein
MIQTKTILRLAPTAMLAVRRELVRQRTEIDRVLQELDQVLPEARVKQNVEPLKTASAAKKLARRVTRTRHTHPAKKLHWSQTAEGRRRQSRRMKKFWQSRRAKEHDARQED